MPQNFLFRLTAADGSVVEGGAESRELAIDHIKHCLGCQIRDSNKLVKGEYLGYKGQRVKPLVFTAE